MSHVKKKSQLKRKLKMHETKHDKPTRICRDYIYRSSQF